MIRSVLRLLCMLSCTAVLSAQESQLEFPAPSPASTLKQRLGLTDIEIVYSRPSVKNRPVFGGLVPYGQLWRTGANASTDITFSTDVKLNGASVPKGTYSLFSIPGKTEWTLIVNKVPAQPGTSKYDQATDLVRVKAQPVKQPQKVETFTIDINDLRDQSATLNLIWENTRVPLKIETDVVSELQPKIKAAMSAPGPDDKKPYYQAAAFYYDHGLDINNARQWIDAAVKQTDYHSFVHLQAKIMAKQGDKAAAIKAAERSTELAIKAEGPDSLLVKMNRDLILSLR